MSPARMSVLGAKLCHVVAGAKATSAERGRLHDHGYGRVTPQKARSCGIAASIFAVKALGLNYGTVPALEHNCCDQDDYAHGFRKAPPFYWWPVMNNLGIERLLRVTLNRKHGMP